MIRLLRKLPFRSNVHEIITRNRQALRDFNKARPLTDYSFVVFDTELTGLDRKQDEIISIGAVRIRDLQIELGDTFHYYVQPQNLDHTRATLVHKITPEQLRQAPPLEEVLPKFLSFIDSDPLVGHFIGIDITFLNRATKRVFNGTVANPHIDTLRMAQIYKRLILGKVQENSTSGPSQYNLQNLTAEFNLPFFDAHDALEDALQTAYLFLFLAKKLRSEGVVTLADLYAAGRGINWATL